MQDYIEQRDGGYYIAGTRIGLDSIILAFKDGESPETILQSFPLALWSACTGPSFSTWRTRRRSKRT